MHSVRLGFAALTVSAGVLFGSAAVSHAAVGDTSTHDAFTEEVGRPDGRKPDVGWPDGHKPVVGWPDGHKPVVGWPDGRKPVVGWPDATATEGEAAPSIVIPPYPSHPVGPFATKATCDAARAQDIRSRTTCTYSAVSLPALGSLPGWYSLRS